MDRSRKFKPYKVPGGEKVKLDDDESLQAFNSYYPQWDKHFYMAPPYVAKRNSLFEEDSGYIGETKIAQAFLESKINGILISNFSNSDRNNIIESKEKEKFECDFILITKDFGMWIIEVRKSKPNRIETSIEEKFEQVIKNRNHIIKLSEEMFDKKFSDTLGSVFNCLIAIPDADPKEFERFKMTETWRSFRSENQCYKVDFITDESSVIERHFGEKNVSMIDPKLLVELERFYACLTLVKTSLLSFDPEKFISRKEKINIRDVTDGMHPNEYHIILSPEQWSILQELPTHLQITGEAATGKTELLKAALFKVLKYSFNNEDQSNPKSKISNFAEGVEHILFVILGDKPYLRETIEEFVGSAKEKLGVSKTLKPTVDVFTTYESSARNIDDELRQLLQSVDNLGNTFVLIDECYHGFTDPDILKKLDLCHSCWIAAVLTGQDPTKVVKLTASCWPLSAKIKNPFSKRVLRRLYRGTRGITAASTTLRLASFSDVPICLANQFSYVVKHDDIKLKVNTEEIEELNLRDALLVIIGKKKLTGSGNVKCVEYIQSDENKTSMYDVKIKEDCMYQTRCTGVEWSSVYIVLRISVTDFQVERDTSIRDFLHSPEEAYKLLSMYTSRAVNNCVIYCIKEDRDVLRNKLFPTETVQFVRSLQNSEIRAFPVEDLDFDLKSINPRLDALKVTAGANTNRIDLFQKLLPKATRTTLHTVFGVMMEYDHPVPHSEIVKEFAKADSNFSLGNETGYSLLSIANGHADVVRVLIEAGVDINFRGNYGFTPLMFAASNGYTETVEEMLKATDVNVNLQEEKGETSLMFAARNGHLEIVVKLIEAGANVNLQSTYGETALMFAARSGHRKIVAELIKGGIKAYVNLKNKAGETSLIFAATRGHTEVVQELIKFGADVNLKNVDGHSPFVLANHHGNTDVLQELINAGADTNLEVQNEIVPSVFDLSISQLQGW